MTAALKSDKNKTTLSDSPRSSGRSGDDPSSHQTRRRGEGTGRTLRPLRSHQGKVED